MFSAGDKVVHPGYGPGVVKRIEHRQVIGEEKRYYVIDMLTGGTTLMTPVNQADNVGLRAAIGESGVAELLKSLRAQPVDLADDFRQRQAQIEERLKEGSVFESAAVVRDMAWYGHSHGLTKRDSQLMQRAEELVAGELALVQEIDLKEASSHVQSILADAVGAGQGD